MRIAVSYMVLATGCSMFMHSMERPTATVRDVSVSSTNFGGAAGELRLDVTNPNAFGVPLSGIDWELSVGGARAVMGAVRLQQEIPARGVAPVTTTLTLTATDAAQLASVMVAGQRSYAIDARLHFATAVGQLDVDVHKVGTLAF